jgi:hypothetical protein
MNLSPYKSQDFQMIPSIKPDLHFVTFTEITNVSQDPTRTSIVSHIVTLTGVSVNFAYKTTISPQVREKRIISFH